MMDDATYNEITRCLKIALITDTPHEFRNAFEFFIGLWQSMNEYIHPISGVHIFYLGDDHKEWLFMTDDLSVLWVNKLLYYELFNQIITVKGDDIVRVNGIFMELMDMYSTDPVIAKRYKLIKKRGLISSASNYDLMVL